MRINPIPLITAFICFSITANVMGQLSYSLQLKSGTLFPEKNYAADQVKKLNLSAAKVAGKSYVIIQFEELLSDAEKAEMKNAGIELLDYIPNYAYTATVAGSIDFEFLGKFKIRTVFEIVAFTKNGC
ncbi:MAG: hypothetical protein IPM85_01805 [Chitinophagaceae bacterium]|nr:hypothetical protein [Chitinophagaceae bacterium]